MKNETMNDSISRQAALDAVSYGTFECYEARKAIRALPSTDRTGHWVFDVDGYFWCSYCGKYPDYQVRTSDFCPNCGAVMDVSLMGYTERETMASRKMMLANIKLHMPFLILLADSRYIGQSSFRKNRTIAPRSRNRMVTETSGGLLGKEPINAVIAPI